MAQARLVDLANLAAAALATVCAGWRARRSAQRLRGSWLALTAACAAWTVGQLLWIRLTWTDGYSFPSPADAAYLLFPPLAGLALLLRPTDTEVAVAAPGARRGDDQPGPRADRLADGRRTRVQWAAATDHALDRAVAIAYPILDVLLLVLTVLTLARSPAARLPLGLITGGLLAFVVADITFVYQQAAGANPISPVDVGWSLGFECIALAALVRSGPRPGPGAARRSGSR